MAGTPALYYSIEFLTSIFFLDFPDNDNNIDHFKFKQKTSSLWGRSRLSKPTSLFDSLVSTQFVKNSIKYVNWMVIELRIKT